jgi:D-glycero-alpha-D-manno-heptose-7-phosphate kinase
LSAAIDKYLYVVVKKKLGIVEHKYRINWSTVEFTNDINKIENPVARECLKFFIKHYFASPVLSIYVILVPV